MSDDANGLKDLKEAFKLLHGELLLDRHGLPVRDYLPEDCEDEARSAIARLLRNLHKPLDPAVRLMLAALFDPKPETHFTFDGSPIERKIKFVGRHRGNRREDARMLKLADAVAGLRFRDQKPLSREDAINQVAEHFKTSTRHVEQAMERFKDWFAPEEQSLRGFTEPDRRRYMTWKPDYKPLKRGRKKDEGK